MALFDAIPHSGYVLDQGRQYTTGTIVVNGKRAGLSFATEESGLVATLYRSSGPEPESPSVDSAALESMAKVVKRDFHPWEIRIDSGLMGIIETTHTYEENKAPKSQSK